MTPHEAERIAELVMDYAQGMPLQWRLGASFPWEDINDPTFDFTNGEYRVKPKPRELWVYSTAFDKSPSASERLVLATLAPPALSLEGWTHFVEVP